MLICICNIKKEVIFLKDLTKRQEEILDYIKSYIASHGYPPAIREIGKDLGLSSPATIHAHLANLEKKVPVSWINETGNGVTEEMIDYLLPLIQGELSCFYDNGVPDYIVLK